MSMLINGVVKRLGPELRASTDIVRSEAEQRFAELKTDNLEIPKKFRMHAYSNAFPAIAVYEALRRHGIGQEEAIDGISAYFDGICDRYAGFLRGFIRAFHLSHKVPSLFEKISLSTYSPDSGWKYRKPEGKDHQTGTFAIIECSYMKMCQKYRCTEIVRALCDSDDRKYAGLHTDLVWHRSGTIGKGAECCDFSITDICRSPAGK